MRILLANKFLRQVGGAETAFFDEWRWLEEAGHHVIPFGMAHTHNVASDYARYWPAQVSYDRLRLSQGVKAIWSREAAARLGHLVAQTRPAVAHVHNIYHQLSPSILAVLQHAGIPIVLTAHDYKLVCPNYRLYTQGAVCSRCVGSHPWHALRHRCLKDSWAISGLAALESAIHRRLGAYAGIDCFLAPSQFLKEKLLQGGFPGERVMVLPHAMRLPPEMAAGPGRFLLYAGRLVAEKGIASLLEAAHRLPAIPFVVAGEGPLRPGHAGATAANVDFLGAVPRRTVASLMQQAVAVVMPSQWPEAFGMSALEAMAAGIPVIASRSGGLPELVRHEQSGLLVPPGDTPALAAAIERLWSDRPLARRLGAAARQQVHLEHDPDDHGLKLLALFEQLQLAQQARPRRRKGPS